jgi:hypothetical protein
MEQRAKRRRPGRIERVTRGFDGGSGMEHIGYYPIT